MRYLLLCFLLVVISACSAFANEDWYKEDSLDQYLQVDDLVSGKYDNPEDLPVNSCARTCVKGDHRLCYYRFTIEAYTVMGAACGNCSINGSHTDCYNHGCIAADGFEKGCLVVNRRMPSPSIQVCLGDCIVVDVTNKMPGRSTTIHWHGIRQANHKFMDGVPMVNQCPIEEATTFRYSFVVEERGTNFYHSHDGLQKMDGFVGSLIVRTPLKDDPNHHLYDYDKFSHTVVIQDWNHMMADNLFPGLRFNNIIQAPHTYLIQGKGKYYSESGSLLRDTPMAYFTVQQGGRHVFRIVSGTCFQCPFILTIEKHDFTIIGADGPSTKPYTVNSLTMTAGDRYTIVVNCNQTEGGAFWIHVRAVGLCSRLRSHQLAVLKYNGSDGIPSSPRPTYDISPGVNEPGLTMSPVNSNCTTATKVKDGPCLHDLRSATKAPKGISEAKVVKTIVWAFGNYVFDNSDLFNSTKFPPYSTFLQTPIGLLSFTVNGITYEQPSSPLMTQYKDLNASIFCPERGYPVTTWNKVHRSCLQVTKVPPNSIVDVLAVDMAPYNPDGVSHAIHLHGYDFHICEMGIRNQTVPFDESLKQLMNYMKSDHRRPCGNYPVKKDTFPLSSGGFVLARLFTDNKGMWFMHCHFNYHQVSGMSAILQVGERDAFPSPPKGFPKCGTYLPFPKFCKSKTKTCS